MASFSLPSLGIIQQAVQSLSHIHGSYRAVEILGKAMQDVEEPPEFEEELRSASSRYGSTYEGPTDTTKNMVKGVQAAAETDDPQQREAMEELLALVLGKLTVAQGTRVLSVLLATAGFKPQMWMVILKVCLLAAQTRGGRRIVAEAEPKIRQVLASVPDRNRLEDSVKQLASTLGEKGKSLVDSLVAAAQVPTEAAKKMAESGITFLDQLRPADDKKSS